MVTSVTVGNRSISTTNHGMKNPSHEDCVRFVIRSDVMHILGTADDNSTT